MHTDLLYFLDKQGISKGYKPLWHSTLKRLKIPSTKAVCVSVYGEVTNALRRFRNDNNWSANPEKADEIWHAFESKLQRYKPRVVVISCPAVLGALTEFNPYLRHVNTCRGSVYWYNGIPCIIVLPFHVIHRQTKTVNASAARSVDDDEEELDYGNNNYVIKSGHWVLTRDWAKVGRVLHGEAKTRPPLDYFIVRDLSDLRRAEALMDSFQVVACDIETAMNEVSCHGFYGLLPSGKCMGFVIPILDQFKPDGQHWDEQDHAEIHLALKKLYAKPVLKAFQNGAYDASFLVRDRMPPANYRLDTILIWHSILPEIDKSLDFISSILFDDYQYWKADIKGVSGGIHKIKPDEDMETYWRYNVMDCQYTLLIAMRLMPMLKKTPWALSNYCKKLRQNHAGLILSMRGVKANFARREELRAEYQAQYETNLATLRTMVADPNFNPDSSTQKKSLVYDVLGAPRYTDKGKPAKGRTKPSSGKNALRMIKTRHPLYKRILDQMEATIEPRMQISNVCDMKLRTGRFRTHYSAVGTVTNRFGSRKSNFNDGGNAQNIRGASRDWLEADEDYILFEVDYSQSDAVFIAFESQDRKYMETMTSGKDTHAFHCAMFFKRNYDAIVKGKKAGDPEIVHPTKGIRNISKRIVHGANFQMHHETLYVLMGRDAVVAAAVSLGYKNAHTWSDTQLLDICKRFLKEFRALYPRLTANAWYKEIREALVANGGRQTDAYGCTRLFLGDPDSHATQREATSQYGQANTAGNINRTFDELLFGYIPEKFRDGPNPHRHEIPLRLDSADAQILLQTHDSLAMQFNTKVPNWKQGVDKLLTVMERPVIIHGREVSVPTDAEYGKQWSKKMTPLDRNNLHALDRLTVSNQLATGNKGDSHA